MALAYDRGSAQRGPVQRMGSSSSLAELLNVILDKGIVIDAWVRVSVVGIEILTIEARIVVASVETYLRYAEAIGLTALASAPPAQNGVSSRQNGQEREQVSPPSADDVHDYLADHPEGLRLGELEAYFDAPRRELAEVVNQLVDDDRARQDEEHKLFYASDDE